MKVLIIATEKDGMWELQNTVESATPDIEIFACNSFGEAFEYRGGEPCELALIEYSLCVGSKRKLLRRIRKKHPGIWIYLMVDYLDRSMKLRSYKADGFLLKPIISEDIAFVVNEEMSGNAAVYDMSGDADAESYDAEGNRASETEGETADKAESKAKSKAESKAKGKAESKAKGKAESKAESETADKAEGKAKGKAESKAKSKAESKAKGKAESKAEGETAGKVVSATEGETADKAESKAKGKAESKAKSKAESKATSATEGETASEAVDKAESKAASATEGETASEAESKAEAETANSVIDETSDDGSEAKSGLRRFFLDKYNVIALSCGVIVVIALTVFGVMRYERWQDSKALREQQLALLEQMKKAEEQQGGSVEPEPEPGEEENKTDSADAAIVVERPQLQKKMQVLYEQNQDTIGWLSIPGTIIDYPVMQTMDDEEYYIDKDFYGVSNRNGCLFMDTDSTVGVGTAANKYTYLDEDGRTVITFPSTNLIIYGHTMRTGDMFGGLVKYAEEEYGRSHSEIYFDTLYEHRKYELIAAFYSKIYNKDQNIFKYYKFFQADTQEEFDYWYENIMVRSVYDTNVTAEFGDEFITLSCCAYEVENGRFVVVGKRVE